MLFAGFLSLKPAFQKPWLAVGQSLNDLSALVVKSLTKKSQLSVWGFYGFLWFLWGFYGFCGGSMGFCGVSMGFCGVSMGLVGVLA